MRFLCKCVIYALRSKCFATVLAIYCAASFYLGQMYADMSIFAASGSIMSACGLLSLIRFTTIEKYIHQDATIDARKKGVDPVLTQAEEIQKSKQHISPARMRVKSELHAEVIGIVLIVVGAFISGYGSYVPLFWATA